MTALRPKGLVKMSASPEQATTRLLPERVGSSTARFFVTATDDFGDGIAVALTDSIFFLREPALAVLTRLLAGLEGTLR